MIKKTIIVVAILGCGSFIWLNSYLLPQFGITILKVTLPFYSAFIIAGWCVGYLVAVKKSEKTVNAAKGFAALAVQEQNENMLISSKMKEYYKQKQKDIENAAERNRMNAQKIDEKDKLNAAEAERLTAIRSSLLPYEELQTKFKACEAENASLRSQLKRKKQQVANAKEYFDELTIDAEAGK